MRMHRFAAALLYLVGTAWTSAQPLAPVPAAFPDDPRLAHAPVRTDRDPPTDTQPAERINGKKRLTFDLLQGAKRVDFDGEYARGLSWLPDGRSFLQRTGGRLMAVDADSGVERPAYDREKLLAALRAHGDFDNAAADRLADSPGAFSADRTRALLAHERRLYVYEFAANKLTRLTREPADRDLADFSPGGRYVSFVRGNNLYTIEARGGREHTLTRDGNERIYNGVLDWVYEEEVYGRGQRRAHWWRRDDQYVAFLRLDDAQVPEYTIIDHVPDVAQLEKTHYPKAGEPNPLPRIGISGPKGGRTVWVDLSRYDGQEILIVRVGWAPDGALVYQVQDRLQTWLELHEADPRTGQGRLLLRETSPAWVDVLEEPYWLADGSFLWISQRDGWAHLYHYARDGRLTRRLTEGDWEVRELYGTDAAGFVYFGGTKDTPVENHAYRVALAGGSVARLTQPNYSHAVAFAPGCGRFIDTYSDATTPPKVHLCAADGTPIRVISPNPVNVLSEYALGESRFVRFAARDGYELNAWLLLPPTYESGQRYPVWCPVYAGPHAPTVSNQWGGLGYLQNQMLAQHGYLVWVCDPRSASGQGAVSAWHAYQRLGETELRDIEDGVRWLIDQGIADPARIGITGGSYGGYMTCYALTHSDMFRVGIAVSSVTDWRQYDSVYTERYMRRPSDNPEGYERSSAVKAADRLRGRLLLIHGGMDDNVHYQNAVQLIDALQRAGKQFQWMKYPRDRHGIFHGGRHFRELRWEYLRENL